MKLATTMMLAASMVFCAGRALAEETDAEILKIAATARLVSLYIAQGQCGSTLAAGMIADAVTRSANDLSMTEEKAIEIATARAKAEVFEMRTGRALAGYCIGTNARLAKVAGKTDGQTDTAIQLTTLYIAQTYCRSELAPGKLSAAVTKVAEDLFMPVEKVIEFATERAEAQVSDMRANKTLSIYCLGVNANLADGKL
ncbi:hypothetical protein EV128_10861 [Rhizobium azibense]|nr:hypothetical protein EV128_10861 [Rhizobium azibense]